MEISVESETGKNINRSTTYNSIPTTLASPPGEHLGPPTVTSTSTSSPTTFKQKQAITIVNAIRDITRQHAKNKRRRQPSSKNEAVHKYRLEAIANYKAPTDYPPTTTAVTFDPTIPATQKPKRPVKRFPHYVRNKYRQSGMWHSSEDRQRYKSDSESYAICEEYRKGVANDPNKVVVPRRRFPSRQPASLNRQCAANTGTDTSATEQLVLTPAEVKRVGEFKWTKVKKGAKAEPDQAPPPIITSNPFNALSPPKNRVEHHFDASHPHKHSATEAERPQETALNTAVADSPQVDKGGVRQLKQSLQAIRRKRKERQQAERAAARQQIRMAAARQQIQMAAARRAERIARHFKQNEDKKKRSENARLKRRADQQRMIYLNEKYGGVIAAAKALNYLARPTKAKLKKLRAQAAADAAAYEARREYADRIKRAEEVNNFDITAAVAESWDKREQPSSILDTGYSGKNIITPADAQRANLPNLGPSLAGILDANGGMSIASGKHGSIDQAYRRRLATGSSRRGCDIL